MFSGHPQFRQQTVTRRRAIANDIPPPGVAARKMQAPERLSKD
jgi:hypothetical protein